MKTILELPGQTWDMPPPPGLQEEATHALEEGSVVALPGLRFAVSKEEGRLLDPRILSKAKNVSYTPWTGRIGGTSCIGEDAELLKALLARYCRVASQLAANLFSHYKPGLRVMRTSLRPAEIAGRKSSWRKDDSLLHVDAFPSQPTYGTRIFRIFCNVNPTGRPRVWRVGEPFENVARRFVPGISRPFPGSATAMRLLGLTKKRRSEYDHYMVKLHDSMKSDAEYQRSVGLAPVEFPAGTTWIVFTDSVSHAALSGQHQFEQTFFLPVQNMRDETRSPLRVLERMTGRALI